MLKQDKETLKAHLKTSALQIRERELNLFHDSLNSVSTQAALFAGFAFGALVEFEIPEDASTALVAVFTLCSVVTLVLNLHCVVHAISVCVWGPGLALRGLEDDSMIRAVEGMRAERLAAFQVGFAGTVGIQVAVAAMSLMAAEPWLSASVCAVLALSVASTVHTIARIRRKFSGEHDPHSMTALFDSNTGLPTLASPPTPSSQPSQGVVGHLHRLGEEEGGEESKHSSATTSSSSAASSSSSSSPSPCCFPLSVRRKGQASGNALASERFSAVQVNATALGPPLCSHSGYLFRRTVRGKWAPFSSSSATSSALSSSSSSTSTSWDPASKASDRLFFVLFEDSLWTYKARRQWNARDAPAEVSPLTLSSCRLLVAHSHSADGEHANNDEGVNGLVADDTALPRHAILSALRKQVTGDSDVRIRDFVSDRNLRASLSTSLNAAAGGGGGGGGGGGTASAAGGGDVNSWDPSLASSSSLTSGEATAEHAAAGLGAAGGGEVAERRADNNLEALKFQLVIDSTSSSSSSSGDPGAAAVGAEHKAGSSSSGGSGGSAQETGEGAKKTTKKMTGEEVVLEFRAETVQEKRAWVEALARVVAVAPTLQPQPPLPTAANSSSSSKLLGRNA